MSDNGKVFTGRFGPGKGEVLFDRICRENDIRHLLTAPYSPTTTGKVERFHKTMKREFLDGKVFESIAEAQSELDAWVHQYNVEREHQSIGNRPPAERFQLARREVVVSQENQESDAIAAAIEQPQRRLFRRVGSTARSTGSASRTTWAGSSQDRPSR